MKMKKFLLLSLMFVFMVLGTVKVEATEYGYGQWCSKEKFKCWDLETNKSQIQSMPGGVWYDDTLVFENSENGIVSKQWLDNYVQAYGGNSSYEYIGDGKYTLNIDGNLTNKAETIKENSSGFLWWVISFVNLHNTSFGDAVAQYNFELDFSYLNKYYEKYNKMPEVIVYCAFAEEKLAIGDEIASALEFISVDTKMIFFYDSFDQPEDFRFNLFFNKEFNLAEASFCEYYATDPNVDLNVCHSFDDELDNLKVLYNNFGEDSTEYTTAKENLITKCENYTATLGTSIEDADGNVVTLACYESCKYLNNRLAEIEGEYQDDYRCGAIGTKLAAWILRMLKIIRYIVPVLVIILSVLDFIGAVGSNNDDAMKKASQKFTKRIIATIVLFLLPVILQFLFDIFKIPGLESSNPFCMK